MAPPESPERRLGRETERARRFAWVAARLHGVSKPFFRDFTREQLGWELDYNKASKAASPLSARSSWRGKQGRPRTKPPPQGSPDTAPALWEWMLVDEPALALLRVLYRLPNDGLPRPELLEVLARLGGVRQIIEISGDLEVLVIAIVENLEEANHLRARIQDHAVGQPVRMDLLSHENHQPARQTWIGLARRQLGLNSTPAD